MEKTKEWQTLNFHDVFARKVTTNPISIIRSVTGYEHDLNLQGGAMKI